MMVTKKMRPTLCEDCGRLDRGGDDPVTLYRVVNDQIEYTLLQIANQTDPDDGEYIFLNNYLTGLQMFRSDIERFLGKYPEVFEREIAVGSHP